MSHDWDTGEDGTPSDRRLGEVVDAFSARGIRLPVAVAHAVAVDLLAEPIGAGGALSAEDVRLDAHGRSFAARPVGNVAVIELLSDLLGVADGDLPPSAGPLLALFDDFREGRLPPQGERIRIALARHLGPPATREEVARLAHTTSFSEPRLDRSAESEAASPTPVSERLTASDVGSWSDAVPDPPPMGDDAGAHGLDERGHLASETPTLRPAPAADPAFGRASSVNRSERNAVAPWGGSGMSAAADVGGHDDDRGVDGMGAAYVQTSDVSLPYIAATQDRGSGITDASYPAPPDRPASDVRASDVSASDLEASGERPVVRLKVPRSDPPVSVRTAPAARRSARPGATGNDAILGPSEERGWIMWVLAVAVVGAGAYFLLFY